MTAPAVCKPLNFLKDVTIDQDMTIAEVDRDIRHDRVNN